jgi:hypothetical protein
MGRPGNAVKAVSGTMNVCKKEFQLQPLFEEIINKARQF